MSGDRRIVHRRVEGVPADYTPLYAIQEGNGVAVFFVQDNLLRFIASFVDSKTYYYTGFPVEINVLKNQDGSFSFMQGDKFWSARKGTDVFDLRPKALQWEYLYLDKADCPIEIKDEEVPEDAKYIYTIFKPDKNILIYTKNNRLYTREQKIDSPSEQAEN